MPLATPVSSPGVERPIELVARRTVRSFVSYAPRRINVEAPRDFVLVGNRVSRTIGEEVSLGIVPTTEFQNTERE